MKKKKIETPRTIILLGLFLITFVRFMTTVFVEGDGVDWDLITLYLLLLVLIVTKERTEQEQEQEQEQAPEHDSKISNSQG